MPSAPQPHASHRRPPTTPPPSVTSPFENAAQPAETPAPPSENAVRLSHRLEVCRRCHQPNLVPVHPPLGMRVLCVRCDGPLRSWSRSLHNNHLAGVLAAAALLFYLPAVTLPLMRLERFGLVNEVGLIEGVVTLMHHGNFVLGVVLLICSVLLPVGKVLALLLLSTRGPRIAPRRRSWIFHVVEWTGRFSVLDVLLVAVLIAAVKVGDLVSVQMSPGLLAFALVVFLSMLATWAFDADTLWEAEHAAR